MILAWRPLLAIPARRVLSLFYVCSASLLAVKSMWELSASAPKVLSTGSAGAFKVTTTYLTYARSMLLIGRIIKIWRASRLAITSSSPPTCLSSILFMLMMSMVGVKCCGLFSTIELLTQYLEIFFHPDNFDFVTQQRALIVLRVLSDHDDDESKTAGRDRYVVEVKMVRISQIFSPT